MSQKRRRAMAVAALGVFGAASLAFGQADVIVGDLTGPTNGNGQGPRKWGTVTGTTGYSIGTVSCNIGTVPLDWFGNNENHPVIAQHLFRISDGRIEQLGQSWVKHGICALQQDLCQVCDPYDNGGCEVKLGVGCSDPYSSSLNGSQGGLGPTSEVNASTGEFAWPYGDAGQQGNAIYKRIQVDNDDLNPANHPNAVIVGQGQYVAKDDAAAGNGLNNSSYRTAGVGSLNGGGYNLFWTGSTQQQQPAIQAWQDHGLGQNQADPDVYLTTVDVPNDGRFWVGYKVSDNGDGTWHYEYAIQNLNSHRSGASFSVPAPPGVDITNIAFHDVDFHSGEPFDPTDWNIAREANAVVWSSPETYDENPNSNALRWGTLYNFSFDADAEPVVGPAQIGLFRPGADLAPDAMVLMPAGDCIADFDGDGQLTILDFVAMSNAFQAGDLAADIDGDGELTILDFVAFQALFLAGC